MGTFDSRPSGAGRAKAFGLSLLYVGLAILLVKTLAFGLPPTQEFLREAADLVGAVLALLLLARLIREPIGRFGFARVAGGGWDVLIGLATGFGMVASSLGIIWVLGGCDFGGVALLPGQILGLGGLQALFDLVVAIFEETLFRSFVLVQLSRAIGFWPAALVSAALFGLAHGGNVNEAPFGLLVAGLGGFALAYSFRRSGALWFAIGWHMAYDYSDDFIFGVPDSGNAPENALLHVSLHGPDWLTGGMVGPEASVPAIIMPLLLVLIARFALPRRAV